MTTSQVTPTQVPQQQQFGTNIQQQRRDPRQQDVQTQPQSKSNKLTITNTSKLINNQVNMMGGFPQGQQQSVGQTTGTNPNLNYNQIAAQLGQLQQQQQQQQQQQHRPSGNLPQQQTNVSSQQGTSALNLNALTNLNPQQLQQLLLLQQLQAAQVNP